MTAPADDRAALRRASVSTEMEAIFGAGATDTTPATPAAIARPLVKTSEPEQSGQARPRRRAGLLFGAAAAVLVAGGLAIGVPSLYEARTPAPPRAGLSMPLIPPTRIAVAPKPQPPPIEAPKPPVVAEAAPVVPVAPPPAAAPKKTVPHEAERQVVSRRRDAPVRSWRTAAPRDEDYAEDAPRRGPCAGLRPQSRHACMLDALAAADGRLRRAYESAVATGVSRRELLSSRERWAMLRPNSRRRPEWVIQRYDSLTRELQAASSRSQ